MEIMVYTNHWKTIEIKEPQLWHFKIKMLDGQRKCNKDKNI